MRTAIPGVRNSLLAVLLSLAASHSPGFAAKLEDGLVGYWLLAGDCEDRSPEKHDARNRGVTFASDHRQGKPQTVAVFDGRTSHIEVANSQTLNFGRRAFSISLLVRTDQSLDDVLGDLLSKYDPAQRKGFNLGLTTHAGMTSSQSNYRNLHFGIDDGKLTTWRDCGRPGNAVFICAMAVHEGHLYAGTFETGELESGHVFRYDGEDQWTDCGSPDKSNSVMSLAVYRGRLYAGTACYRAKGSALPESPNRNPGGRVYRYAGGKTWVDCGRLADAGEVFGLAVYRDELFAIPLYSAGVFRFDGKTGWASCGVPGDQRAMSLAVFNGHLYSTGNGSAGVWRFDGGARWTFCGKQADNTQTYSIAIHQGKMLAGTWPSGSVFRYEGGERWANCGRLGQEKEVMAMAVCNGKLYAGTLPLAQVYRYDGDNVWTLTGGQLDTTPNVVYRRAWTMALYQGKLFAGTMPSGRVLSLEPGKSVTHDHELPTGWRHVAAVKEADRLKLYLEGQLVASSSVFNADDLDISNGQPLQIGLGAHDYFNGRMSELRIYNRALSASEVKALFKSR